MKIFLSHSSRDKALVREIRSYLPRYITTWLDEDDLLVGMELRVSIRDAIQEQADYVVIFLGREAINSDWVKSELTWALERERQIGRNFILPVLLDDVWREVEPCEFRDRLYLKCFDQSEAGVKAFSEKLKDQLFAWLCQHLDDSRASALQEERKAESFGKTLEKARDVFVDMTECLPKQLASDLQEIIEHTVTYSSEIQIERLSKKIKRELVKQREEFKKAKVNYEKQEDPLARLSISLTFGGHDKVLELLNKLNDEIEMWENHQEEINTQDVIERIKGHLVSKQ